MCELTGGTSVEHLVPANHTVRWHARGCCEHGHVEKCCNHGSPWHLPLDVLAALLPEVRQNFGNTPTWCVVRQPDDRWKSSQAFIAHSRKRWPDSAAFPARRSPRTPIQLQALFAKGRFAIEWDEEFVHLQPQSWMVWDAHGQPQCSCAVAFENLGSLLASHTRSHNVLAAGGYHQHVGPSVTSAACNGNCTDSIIAHQNLYLLDFSLCIMESGHERWRLGVLLAPAAEFDLVRALSTSKSGEVEINRVNGLGFFL